MQKTLILNTEEAVVQTRDLSFGFTKHRSLFTGIDLKVPKGAIYGFLGPNGAGKTTLIRILLNLLKPDTGEVRLFGRPFGGHAHRVFSCIGSLIETPSLYGHLTGLDNLRIAARIRNLPGHRVKDALHLVGLGAASGKQVNAYSLGMKQRLGLALALVSLPELLVLDEPINGLDPEGIIQIRELLLSLNREHGISILLSSHLLAEVEKLVSHIGILSQGRLAFQGSFQQLLHLSEQMGIVELNTDQNTSAMELLSSNGQLVGMGKQFLEVTLSDRFQLPEIVSLLTASGLQIHRLQKKESSLEEIFLSLVTENNRNATGKNTTEKNSK